LSARTRFTPQVKEPLVRMTKRGIITTKQRVIVYVVGFILALVVGALMLLAIGKTRSLPTATWSSGHSARRLPQLNYSDRGSLADRQCRCRFRL